MHAQIQIQVIYDVKVERSLYKNKDEEFFRIRDKLQTYGEWNSEEWIETGE